MVLRYALNHSVQVQTNEFDPALKQATTPFPKLNETTLLPCGSHQSFLLTI